MSDQKPVAWIRAVDEELVSAHLGVADASDSYEFAKKKLNLLINWHIAVAADPAVNGGMKLVPVEPTPEMVEAGLNAPSIGHRETASPSVSSIYSAMLSAAPSDSGGEK